MLSLTGDTAVLTPRTRSMTRLEKQKAAARAEDAPLSPLCLVDLPHSLLVLVLRWVEALTMPGKPKRKLEDLESGSDAEACAEASRVSWLIATFLGCESLCSALRSAVRDDGVRNGVRVLVRVGVRATSTLTLTLTLTPPQR